MEKKGIICRRKGILSVDIINEYIYKTKSYKIWKYHEENKGQRGSYRNFGLFFKPYIGNLKSEG